MYPVIMHINYMEQGQTIEEICRKAVKMGYDGVEFRRRRAGKDETPEQYLDEIGRWSREYGLRYVLFGGPGVNAMTPDRALIRRELDDYKRFLDLASTRVELSILNFFTGPLMDPTVDNTRVAYHLHGSFCAQPWHWESAAAVCQELADYAAPLGVKFAFETHMSYLHDIAESAKKLCDMIDRPNFGINLDYGNTQYFTCKVAPLEDAIEICGDKLFYTHMKNAIQLSRPDANKNPDMKLMVPSALSEGGINHRAYVKKLYQVGFGGPIGIEAPRPGDREWYAKQDLAYIREVMADIDAE